MARVTSVRVTTMRTGMKMTRRKMTARATLARVRWQNPARSPLSVPSNRGQKKNERKMKEKEKTKLPQEKRNQKERLFLAAVV